jgi:hypothetical protein
MKTKLSLLVGALVAVVSLVYWNALESDLNI